MSKINLIHADAKDCCITSDLILTDPPYDMPGLQLAEIVKSQNCAHLVLITTMRQLLEMYPALGWNFGFDFIFDAVSPKKSRSTAQPNYTHHTGVYLYKAGEKSRFNRKKRQRSDIFEGNGYWPTTFYAPRERGKEHGLAKNLDAVTDLLGSFDNINHVADLFAGSGTVPQSAFELGLNCTAVERDKASFDLMSDKFKFLEAL